MYTQRICAEFLAVFKKTYGMRWIDYLCRYNLMGWDRGMDEYRGKGGER